MKPIFTILIIGLGACTQVAAAATAPQADIVGIKLGMTAGEVQAVLKSDARPFKWKQVRAPLSDFPKEPFLVKIEASRSVGTLPSGIPASQESLTIHFSRPPGDGRVVAVERSIEYERNTIAEPLKDDIVEAMKGKYGSDPVLFADVGFIGGTIHLTWMHAPTGERRQDLQMGDLSTRCHGFLNGGCPGVPCPIGAFDSFAFPEGGVTMPREGYGLVENDGYTPGQELIDHYDECGLTIGSTLEVDSRNHVFSFLTSMIDYAALNAQREKYRAYWSKRIERIRANGTYLSRSELSAHV